MADAVDEHWHRIHDIFNLICLPWILLVTSLHLYEGSQWFWIQFWVFLSYLLVDTLWLVLKPKSVASPTVIIGHHIVCLVGWIQPAFNERKYSVWISQCVLVEINTWFLIARRTWKSNLLFSLCFYFTWIVLRLIMYPVILVQFTSYLTNTCGAVSSLYSLSSCLLSGDRPGLLLLFLFVTLNGLNYKWTFDMLWKMAGQQKDNRERKGL